MIGVTLVDPEAGGYEVVVEGQKPTRHRVTLDFDYYVDLCGRQFTQEWVIVQAFQFLLEREANTEILGQFDLREIPSYFPEFETEMATRIRARQ